MLAPIPLALPFLTFVTFKHLFLLFFRVYLSNSLLSNRSIKHFVIFPLNR